MPPKGAATATGTGRERGREIFITGMIKKIDKILLQFISFYFSYYSYFISSFLFIFIFLNITIPTAFYFFYFVSLTVEIYLIIWK